MSDNEHTLPALRHSEPLSVQNCVGEPIPDLRQPSKEGSKRPSFVTGQDAGDIFPNDPGGSESLNDTQESEGKVATRVSHSFSESRNTETLAGSPADKNVNWPSCPFFIIKHIAKVRHFRLVMF